MSEMKVNWSGHMARMLFFAITAGGFLLWVGSFFLWLLLHLLGVSINLWEMIEALSTAVIAAAVLGAGFVAYLELVEIASSQHMEEADKLFTELNSAENFSARRCIFQNTPENAEERIQAMTEDGRQALYKQTRRLFKPPDLDLLRDARLVRLECPCWEHFCWAKAQDYPGLVSEVNPDDLAQAGWISEALIGYVKSAIWPKGHRSGQG